MILELPQRPGSPQPLLASGLVEEPKHPVGEGLFEVVVGPVSHTASAYGHREGSQVANENAAWQIGFVPASTSITWPPSGSIKDRA